MLFCVRPVIADSWNRCLHAGIHYKDGFCVKVHSKEETIQLLAEKKILIEIAIPIMKTLYKRVNSKNCIVVIADENGIVLDSVGFKEVLEMRKTLHFLPGSDWSEESVERMQLERPLQLMNRFVLRSGALL